MKHCILVKWNKGFNFSTSIVSEIEEIFDKLLMVDGIEKVQIFQNVVNRPNRHDLMICVEMKRDVLSIYDKSESHRIWKEKYEKYIENKAIFDFED